jgi:hypothetical protein
MDCERCKCSSSGLRMSFFNCDMLCSDCEKEEKDHKDYKKAKEEELKQCKKGNFNYPGVGLPKELAQKYKGDKNA